MLRHSCAVSLLQSGADVTMIRDYFGHASIATTGRYITINLQLKTEAMQVFWRQSGIEPSEGTTCKPAPDLLVAFLQAL
ncbi:MAG: tyrosine-type recombinase/integrase [Pseudomonadota bacterium]